MVKSFERSRVSSEKIFYFFLVVMAFFIVSYKKAPINISYVAILLLTIFKIRKEGYRKTGYEVPILLFIGAVYLSMIGAVRPDFAFDNSDGLVKALLFPLILGQYRLSDKWKQNIFRVSSLGSIILIYQGFLEIFGKIPSKFNDRLSGEFNVWIYGALLAYSVIVTIVVLFKEKNNYCKIFFAVILIFDMYCLLLTQSRASWLGVIFGMFFIMLFLNKRLFVIAMITSLIFLGTVFVKFPNNKYVSRIKSIGNVETNTSNKGRFEIWKFGLEKFKESPVNGIGYKNYRFVEEYDKYKVMPRPAMHVHNSFLTVLIDTGIIGFLSYLILLFSVLTKNVRSSSIWGYLVAGIFIGVEFTNGMFDSNIIDPQIQWILYFSLSLVAGGIDENIGSKV